MPIIPIWAARIQTALPASGTDRILAEPTSPLYPPPEIFGTEPEHDWCYAYQKAALAKQIGDWETVVALGNEAAAQGIAPDSTEATHRRSGCRSLKATPAPETGTGLLN